MFAVDLHAALAYRPRPWLALGAGIDAVYGTVKLENAVDFGSLLSADLLARYGPVLGPAAAQSLGISPGDPALDGRSTMEGDDWAFGWNAGLMADLGTRTRVGIGWHSKVDLAPRGTADLWVPPAVTALSGGTIGSRRVAASSRWTLPPTLRLGVRHTLDARWSLLAGAIWTGWHTFESLDVTLADGSPDLVERQDWDDTWRASLGAELRLSPEWTLRAGVEYDQSPVPSSARRPRIPESDIRWIGLGATWEPRAISGLALDLGYTHAFMGRYSLDAEETTTPWLSAGALAGNRLQVEYDTSADAVSFGLRWRF